MSNRDNFTKPTIDILGKRVGFLCSNPDCRKHTVGPNIDPQKATLIGVAAHITAAAPEGPRYDSSLSADQRSHIDNAIWLCSNCSTLIDKDPARFPVNLLEKWKADAENEMLEKILGSKPKDEKIKQPFLEADLIWNSASRSNRGYSSKNPTIMEDDVPVMLLDLTKGPPIIFWEIKWRFNFSIHNNSEVPAYNVKIEDIGETKFDSLTQLHKVNNLPPYKNVDLEATHSHHIEGIFSEADEIMRANIPKELNGLALRISYQDEHRNNYSTIVQIKDGQLTNAKE